MEINIIKGLLISKKGLLNFTMRTLIFLFCATVFSFTPENIFSQNAKIIIDTDKEVSIDQIFDLIKEQTDYTFIYKSELFLNAPKVQLKKGTIKANKLLQESLAFGDFNYVFSDNGTILLNKVEETKNIQQQQVTGTITDSNGLGLPGVTIIEKGTTNGTSTNIQGNYNITVTSNSAVLVFSFVGFTTKEVAVEGQTEINVSLSESVTELGVVNLISTGYQTISREKVTGAAENIDKSFYENSYRQTLQEGLQGSVAGLQIISNNSHPQSMPQVIIRGVGTAFGEGVGASSIVGTTTVLGDPTILTPGTPLYVIDGVPTFDGRDLSNINGNDIKSITVLKDAAAASIYGARAANGVIVVETKSGRSGKSKVTYSSQVGFSEFVQMNERLNSTQLQELFVEGLINKAHLGITDEAGALAFLASPTGTLMPFNANQSTNWGKELTRTGQMTQHNLSASGGKNNNNYYLSLGYLKNETPLKEINFDRVSAKLKYDTRISEKLNVSSIVGYGKTRSNNHETGTSYYNPFRNIYLIRPDFKVYNDDGSYDLSYNYKVNPLGILTDEKRQLETNDFRGALNMNYEIISGLTFETSLSGDYELTENYNYYPSYIGKGANYSAEGVNYANQRNTNIFNWNTRALIRYTKQFGEDHSFGVFVGAERNGLDLKITNVSANELRAGSETLDNGNPIDGDTSRRETSISSLFVNADYDYQGKYLVNASFRRDGSSRFGANNKYGNFYALGLGWNIHKESFLVEVKAINTLKLRASYGVNGNDQIDPFAYSGTFNTTGSYNGDNASTLSSAGNGLIGWEENATFDIGLDFSLFNNRVSGFFDYYNRKTSKLLYNLPVSSLNGDTFVFQNFGGMKNSGIEISLSTKNVVSDNNGFSWNTGITLTTNKNVITELQTDEIISGNYIRKVGEDFNTLNIYGYAGVDPETGNEMYYTDETETATTMVIGEAVKYNHGKTSPDYYASLMNTFSFKNFSLTAQLYTSWGGQVFETNGNAQNDNGFRGITDFSNTSKYVYDNRWQKPGDITDVPKYVYLNTLSNGLTSRWLHDASYIRLKRVELAYNFPNEMLEKTFISALRLHVSADNIWTSVKDKTLTNDPEIGGITGAASFDTPLTKTIYFGLNVSF
ncbi:MAG: SusC/RagA family TonB-linked outer membrane protein [Flavobacteriaceae bacterium]|nr:SusC/RagA family TonB-linked outer membrane protein [Flavobacteriaceae bacterium]